MENERKKIIYVIGTGRSGTTLLDIVLGNATGVVSVGEIVRFPELRGRPHGFAPGSANFSFWAEIGEAFFARFDRQRDFDALRQLASRLESHRYFLCNLLGWINPETATRYREYINAFFGAIFAKTGASVVVDSSKYPGRALALARYLDYDVYYLHLIRSPLGVVSSFAKKDVEQPAKGLLAANLYYFVIRSFCLLVRLHLPKERFLAVRFDDLRQHPAREIARVAAHFNICLDKPAELILAGQPLKVGPLFEGNRIRMKESITFRSSSGEGRLSVFAKFTTLLINTIWNH